jgi:hypothetical protein
MSIYTDKLKQHYEDYFGICGQKHSLQNGGTEKSFSDFYVLEFKPNKIHEFWTYCSVGMSLEREDYNLIELFIFSPRQDLGQVELITVCADYHQNGLPLNLNHTINIGRPWIDNSECEYGFISLPYLDGSALELFEFKGRIFKCYWLIPITKKERNYKITHGSEALEQLFEETNFQYLNPQRKCLIK